MSPIAAFLTGLTTGGLTCLAVQGGLLLGLLAKKDDAGRADKLTAWQRLVLPVTGFVVAKVVIYTVFGLLLGMIGSRLELSAGARAWIQGAAAVFMILTGFRILWPHFLPWLTIAPPASVRRMVRRSAKSQAIAAPALLGLLTVFIPCGTTIALEATALATGSALQAASILFAFTLGTAPLFFVVGVLAKGTTFFQARLKYATALLVVGIGVTSFNAVLTMIDSPFAFRNQLAAWRTLFSNSSEVTAAETNPVINVYPNGYSPANVSVPAGTSVTLQLKVPGSLSCTSIFRIPKLGIQRQLLPKSSTTITTTFPKPGSYLFTCGMGMYSGTITAT